MIGLFFILLIDYVVDHLCNLFNSRKNKGKHRHPHNVRRGRKDPAEIVTTADILGIMEEARTERLILEEN